MLVHGIIEYCIEIPNELLNMSGIAPKYAPNVNPEASTGTEKKRVESIHNFQLIYHALTSWYKIFTCLVQIVTILNQNISDKSIGEI